MKSLALLLFVSAGAVFGQTAAAPIPVPNQQFLDCRSGTCLPLAGGFLYSYTAGTTTPKVTYTDSSGATPNANPVVLNSSGFNTAGGGNSGVWIKGECYKFILKDSSSVIIWTQDNVCNQETLYQSVFIGATGATLIGYTSPKPAVTTVAAQLTQLYNRMNTYPNQVNEVGGSANNAIVGTLVDVNSVDVPLTFGLTVHLVLSAHSLQAGANSMKLNGSITAVPIYANRNGAVNITTGYIVGSIVELVYNGSAWVDMSQGGAATSSANVTISTNAGSITALAPKFTSAATINLIAQTSQVGSSNTHVVAQLLDAVTSAALPTYEAMVVYIVLNVNLQAGANDININTTGVLSIKNQYGNDLTVAHNSGTPLVMMLVGAFWYALGTV